MGLLNRDIAVNHQGHEIALSVLFTGDKFTNCTLQLHIDGILAQEQVISAFSALVGAEITLRGRLMIGSTATSFKATTKFTPLRWNTYTIVADGTEIHREQGTWGGL